MKHTRTVWGATPVDPLRLTTERVRQLRQLCHPDKHAGSALSLEVTRWLNECSKELDADRRVNGQ